MILFGSGAMAQAGLDALPSATLIAGDPPIFDYGSVKVPCSRDAFYTLWEGDTFWLTFGFGASQSNDIATIRAEKQASNLMRFMLLTLAFAPARLVKAAGNGWRKKDPKAHDFVVGELPLPALHNRSMSDAFLGGGNTVINPLWDRLGSQGVLSGTMPGGMDLAPSASSGPLDNMQQAMRYAFSSSVVMKKDMSLDDVRTRATVL